MLTTRNIKSLNQNLLRYLISSLVLLYLVQCTGFLWLWHVGVDCNHHPATNHHRQEHSQHLPTDDNCPICDQLLKILGSYVTEPELILSNIDTSFVYTSFNHQLDYLPIPVRAFLIRPPPRA